MTQQENYVSQPSGGAQMINDQETVFSNCLYTSSGIAFETENYSHEPHSSYGNNIYEEYYHLKKENEILKKDVLLYQKWAQFKTSVSIR